MTYHPNGAIAGFTYGNGIVHSMVQNARQLPAQSVDAFGGTKFLDDTYTYDANGNVMSLTDASAAPTLDNRTWGVVVGAPTVYDGLDRLISVRSTNQFGSLTGNYNALYAYDPLDNLRRNVLGSHDMAYTYDASNRLASVNDGAVSSFGHDSRGRLTTDGRRSQAYVYDLANRMSEVTGKESYLYDGHGRRARTLYASGQIEYYGYGADGRLLQDWSNRRNVRNGYIYLGNTQVAQYEVNITNGAFKHKYQHTDTLGSPVLVTDATKTVLARQSYSPYGRPIGTATQDGTGYTGHFMDVGTGLTYMQQRYYDSVVGRFLSIDPITPIKDPVGYFGRYHYAGSSPLKFVDADGRGFGLLGKGVKLLIKGGDVAATVAGAVEDTKTLFSNDATLRQRAVAGVSLVTEVFSPVTLRDAKAGIQIARGTPTRAGHDGVTHGPANVETRTTRSGETAATVSYPNGTQMDVSPSRVKEYVPNTHPNAPDGARQRVKFDNAQPGTKGWKRDPTSADLSEAGLQP